MTKIGRNTPCPCGSGKKYKHCCWLRERAAPPVQAVDESSTATPLVIWDDDGLDDLSNSVVDLLHEGRVDEAASAAAELLQRFPEVVDGLERTAMVEEARGNLSLAVDFYRKAAHFTQSHTGYDPESTQYYSDKAAELAKRSQGSDPKH